MTKRSSWIVSALVAVVVVALLIWVATYRFAIALVYPPFPTPDYGLQAAIAITGATLTAIAFVLTGLTAARSSNHRARTVTIGSLIMIAIGVLTVILTFTIPA